VNVYGLTSGVQAIATGDRHACALMTGGGVKCWGYNEYGQLGNNSTNDSSVPVNVSGLDSEVQAIATGANHTCAVMITTGALKCWGQNILVPTVYHGLSSGVKGVAAEQDHTCVLTTAGGIKCLGANYNGQLGNNSTTDSSDPVNVYGLTSGMKNVAGKDRHTCGLTTNGGVKCWGGNADGQLGNNSNNNSSVPVNVIGLSSGVSVVAARDWITCAIGTGGALKCWGFNGYGQLGDGTYNNKLTPVAVYGLSSGVQSVAAGFYHTCAVASNGVVKCWGNNENGQLGNNTTTSSAVPVVVHGFIPELISPRGTISNPNPTYTWTAVLDATTYDLYVDNNLAQTLTATEANCDGGTGNCSATPARNLKAGIHTWKVITRNDYGSATSAVQSFTQTSALFGFDVQLNGNMSGLYGTQGTWAVNSTSLYSNMLARITIPGTTGPHYQASIYYNANFSNLDYQVRVMRTGCDSCASKMFFRGDGIPVFAGWKNGYQFNIKRNGTYYVGKTVNGILIPLSNKLWLRSTAIKTGSNWNLLRVTAKSTALKFYINNRLVWSGIDRSRSTGKVGVGIYSNGTGGLNRLYIDYATLTTTVLGATQAVDLTPPSFNEIEISDPNGGNW